MCATPGDVATLAHAPGLSWNLQDPVDIDGTLDGSSSEGQHPVAASQSSHRRSERTRPPSRIRRAPEAEALDEPLVRRTLRLGRPPTSGRSSSRGRLALRARRLDVAGADWDRSRSPCRTWAVVRFTADGHPVVRSTPSSGATRARFGIVADSRTATLVLVGTDGSAISATTGARGRPEAARGGTWLGGAIPAARKRLRDQAAGRTARPEWSRLRRGQTCAAATDARRRRPGSSGTGRGPAEPAPERAVLDGRVDGDEALGGGAHGPER